MVHYSKRNFAYKQIHGRRQFLTTRQGGARKPREFLKRRKRGSCELFLIYILEPFMEQN